MDKIKIIFFDIDGTLIDMEAKQVSGGTTEMLKQLHESGIKICLATGRSPVSLPPFAGVAFDAFLTFNGSLCYTPSETIFSSPIPPAEVRKIIRNAESLGRPVCVATRNRLAANGLDDDLAEYFSFAHQKLTVSEDFEAVCREEIYQVMLGCRESDYAAILRGVGGAKIAAWWDRAVDIIPASGGKGTGIQKILAFYHLDRSEAMAFGDGNNDIEMLTAVGTGVAMGNASPQLKAIADDVCGPASQDGISAYLSSRGMIPPLRDSKKGRPPVW